MTTDSKLSLTFASAGARGAHQWTGSRLRAMSAWLIALVGVIYLGVAAEQAFKGNWWFALVFAGYALSNVGLVFLARTPPP